jgi:hypothetical protein
MNKKLCWILVVLFALQAIAAVVVWAATVPARTARHMLDDFSTMTPGKTTADEALRMTTK